MPIGPGAPTPGGIPGMGIAYLQTIAGVGIANAVQLPAFTNVITNALANNGVLLPPCFPGAQILVINDTSVSTSVFAQQPTFGAADSMIAAGATARATTGLGMASGTAHLFVGEYGEGGNTIGGTGATIGGVWRMAY